MTRPHVPQFRFHVEHSGKTIDYFELEKLSRNKHHPAEVGVIDAINHVRLGQCPVKVALGKYAP